MTILFDRKEVEATPRFIAAVEEWMLAEMEMMGSREGGRWKDCWTWGRCTVGDLACGDGAVTFDFGGEEDKPDDGLGKVAVLSEFELSRVPS